eukprot:TRINITY_DN38659_c0_g1_i1.p1 TRINITY_DN38659_c0_g1~~TRINITY_DN38659_c0_g1_i1.p1  ORF type:complete len:331 (+),score=62.90 TRINITY_DN38659_c0_g1_i1:81-1073(+)
MGDETDVAALLQRLDITQSKQPERALLNKSTLQRPGTDTTQRVVSDNKSNNRELLPRPTSAPEWLLDHVQSERITSVEPLAAPGIGDSFRPLHVIPQATQQSQAAEVQQLRARVLTLEKENNELKNQLRAIRTPPPGTPLLVRTPTPTTPTTHATGNGTIIQQPMANGSVAALSVTAPSFIPINSVGGTTAAQPQAAGNISPSAYQTVTLQTGTPIRGLTSPTTQVTSPGGKSISNVCRHWVVNRCTYGNDCRFVHPPADVLGTSKTTPVVTPQTGIVTADETSTAAPEVTRPKPVRSLGDVLPAVHSGIIDADDLVHAAPFRPFATTTA